MKNLMVFVSTIQGSATRQLPTTVRNYKKKKPVRGVYTILSFKEVNVAFSCSQNKQPKSKFSYIL